MVSVGTLVSSTMVAAEPRADKPTRKSASVSLETVTSWPISPLRTISSVDTVLSVQMRPMSLVERC